MDGLTVKGAEKMLTWRDSWKVGQFDCYKGLGVQVFAEMIGDAEFRKLIMKQLRVPKPNRVSSSARPRNAWPL